MLLLFAFLQLLDFATTMAVFAHGGFEANPVVRAFMPLFGQIGAVLASKVLIVFLVWRFSRRAWLLYVGNAFYALIVVWNTAMLFFP
jgi:hypothetical protein